MELIPRTLSLKEPIDHFADNPHELKYPNFSMGNIAKQKGKITNSKGKIVKNEGKAVYKQAHDHLHICIINILSINNFKSQ